MDKTVYPLRSAYSFLIATARIRGRASVLACFDAQWPNLKLAVVYFGEALTAEKAKMPAPITAPARDLLSAVIFNPPFMLSNVKLTPQLDLVLTSRPTFIAAAEPSYSDLNLPSASRI